ncbi:MAG: acetyl-CoA C-acetyltransferase [Sporichthyaceae bacterium]|nr:acetyl-CoA C-acetyltransferase [Sporichthyaceae bacterium]
MVTEAFVYEAIRTPRGRGKRTGALAGVKPVHLVVGLIDELRRRQPDLDPAAIDDLVLGVVTAVGDEGMDIARTVALVAGLPHSVTGVQVNRFCASGLEAVNLAAARVRSGWAELVLAGGVESMSRVPMGSDGGAWALDPEISTAAGFVPQGISADLLATIELFDREDLDRYAAGSHTKAAKAWADGRFAGSVVPVRSPADADHPGEPLLDHDEHIRADSTQAGLARLPAAFAELGAQAGFDAVALRRNPELDRVNHLHTAGNSSGIVDGAALVLVGSELAGRRYGLRPRARIVAAALHGVDSTIMLTGPAGATRRALDQAGLRMADMDLVEINEAFAAVPLWYQRELAIPPERVNVNGGAIAMGHPLGATGAMLLATALDELKRRELRYGLVTLCAGGGMGIATIVERC